MRFVWLRENPQPHGAEVAWLVARDGVKLRTALFRSGDPSRGTIILLHGRTEFIEKYFETIRDLLARGLTVATLDWRGQGLSGRLLPDRLKGHVASFADYGRDLEDFIANLGAHGAPPPHRILAHSMGAAIALAFLHDHPGAIAGAVLCAPMTRLRIAGMGPDRARLVLRAAHMLRLGSVQVPGRRFHPISEPFEQNVVTHDRDRFQRNKALMRAEPELIVDAPTFGWVKAAYDHMDLLSSEGYLEAIGERVLIVSAGNDALVDNASHAEAARRMPKGEHVVIEGAKHELMQESRALRGRFLGLLDTLIEEGSALSA